MQFKHSLHIQLIEAGFKVVTEHAFAKEIGRRWRFDYAIIDRMVAIEVDGGNWIRGRHARPLGMAADNEKKNTAQAMGWRVFVFNTKQANNGEAFKFLIDHVLR